MSIINQIPPLNLNVPISSLMALIYEFDKNKNDAVNSFDEELSDLEEQRNSVNDSLQEAKKGKEIQAKEIKKLGGTTEGCSVSDKNKRKDNVIKSLESRKQNLQNQINSTRKEKESTEQFYDSAKNTIGNILNTLIELLRKLVKSIGAAITAIEASISSLAAIPLGAGLAGVAILTSIVQLLQTKIFEPAADSISQHEKVVEGEDSIVQSDGNTTVTTVYGDTESTTPSDEDNSDTNGN